MQVNAVDPVVAIPFTLISWPSLLTEVMSTKAARKPAAAKAAVKRAAETVKPVDPIEEETVEDADTRIYQAIFDGVLNHRLDAAPSCPSRNCANCSAWAVPWCAGAGEAGPRWHRGAAAEQGRGDRRAHAREETSQIFEACRAMERVLVELAVTRVTDADLRDLRRQLAEEVRHAPLRPAPRGKRLASGFQPADRGAGA